MVCAGQHGCPCDLGLPMPDAPDPQVERRMVREDICTQQGRSCLLRKRLQPPSGERPEVRAGYHLQLHRGESLGGLELPEGGSQCPSLTPALVGWMLHVAAEKVPGERGLISGLQGNSNTLPLGSSHVNSFC